MDFALDPTSRSPLFRQLQDQIRYAISVGELVPGDQLPSIRELESRLDINRNTVRRAYSELQGDGTLTIRQGREAVVAKRTAPATMASDDLTETAATLAAGVLQQAELEGLDVVQFGDYLAGAARKHDALYPRCALVECSSRQADHFAAHAESVLGRRVVGVNLHDVRGDASLLPSSVRFVLAPHWHVAEAEELLGTGGRVVLALRVRVSDQCGRELRTLDGAIGLVVRDPESAPGYQELLRLHAGRREVRVVLSGDRGDVATMMAQVDHVVYTSPCAELVHELAPARVGTHEIIFEPVSEDLAAVKQQAFPTLVREVSPA